MAALWLTLDSPAITELVDGLARVHGTPRFAAHLTLGGGIHDVATVAGKLSDVARETPCIQLEVRGVEHGDDFFRAIFLAIEESAALAELRERLGVETKSAPHVSLLYGRLPREQRAAAAAGIRAPRSAPGTGLALVNPGAGGWHAVDGWQVFCRARLFGDPDRP